MTAAILVIAGAIFVFTRPILAPGFDQKVLGSEQTNAPEEDSGNTFDTSGDSTSINPNVGEGVKADSYLVYDESTGKILASRNPNTAVAIASLTKLMTAYIVQKYGDLNDAWAIGPSSTNNISPVLGLTSGDRVLVSDLVDSMLIGSANDAAQALGTYMTSTTKKPVIELMNKEASDLGMNSTHYENPIGFDSEQNYSTANDLKLLLNVIHPLALFTEIDRKQSYSFTSETGRAYSVKATNTLLASDPEIHAIKTGFTDEAKGAMITSIHHDDKKIIIIVLASTDRENDTKLLKKQVLGETAPTQEAAQAVSQ